MCVDVIAVIKMPLDEMTVDGMTVDKMTVDEMTVDVMTVDVMTVDVMTVDGMAIDKMAIDKMAVDEMTCCQTLDTTTGPRRDQSIVFLEFVADYSQQSVKIFLVLFFFLFSFSNPFYWYFSSHTF